MKSNEVSIEVSEGNTNVYLDWYYPEIYENQNYIEIDMIHTRGSDGIRVEYESERDGFVIKQPVWKDGNIVKWIEVSFCESWKYYGDNND